MFKNFWGSLEQQQQEAQQRPQETPADSWYSGSSVSSPSSSRPGTPSASSSNNYNMLRPGDRPTHVSPAAAGIMDLLRDKSVDELRKLLSDKDAYNNFLLSVEPLRTQNKLRDDLRNETLQLARENLEKEPRIMELRNQCRIIRTTELAAAQEKLHELEKNKDDALRFYSPASLLHRLQEAMNKTDEESEALHRQLLDQEMDLSSFVQKYKKLRYTYHKRALTHLAAKTSLNV